MSSNLLTKKRLVSFLNLRLNLSLMIHITSLWMKTLRKKKTRLQQLFQKSAQICNEY